MKIIEFTLFVVNLIKQFEFRFKIFFVNGQYCWLNISLLCYCYSFKHLNNFDYFLFFQFINYLLCLYWFCLFVIYQYLVFFIFKMAWIPYYLDSTETKFSFNSLHYIWSIQIFYEFDVGNYFHLFDLVSIISFAEWNYLGLYYHYWISNHYCIFSYRLSSRWLLKGVYYCCINFKMLKHFCFLNFLILNFSILIFSCLGCLLLCLK